MTRLLLLLLAMMAVCTPALADTLVELEDAEPGQVLSVGFSLPRGADVRVEALGLRGNRSTTLAAYAWILQSDDRSLRWLMEADDSRAGEDPLREVEDELRLEAGRYELYLAVQADKQIDSDIPEPVGWLLTFFGNPPLERGEFLRYVPECRARLLSEDLRSDEIELFEVDGVRENALLRHAPLGDSEMVQQGFVLDAPMELRVVAMGELPPGSKLMSDGGWITDMDSHERVWTMDRWNSRHAGGAARNRLSDQRIQLAAGRYELSFGTDESHSFEEFEDLAPHDPFGWGIHLLPGTDFDASAFRLIEDQDMDAEAPIIDLTRAGDLELLEQAFVLERESELRIRALGEFDHRGDEFVDFGWIQEAGSGDMMWEMKDSECEHAGGAEKNLLFEGTVRLPAGSYIAFYLTDASHAWDSWHGGAPFGREEWGMSLHAGEDFDASSFRTVSVEEVEAGQGVLVRMVRMRDNEHRREHITLQKPTELHVYALGEGAEDTMYDYGWILDEESGRHVWEMSWENTEPAGGHGKNRRFDDVLRLEPGSYEVGFDTDGSHSFASWNAPAPRDPMSWGMTIRLLEP